MKTFTDSVRTPRSRGMGILCLATWFCLSFCPGAISSSLAAPGSPVDEIDDFDWKWSGPATEINPVIRDMFRGRSTDWAAVIDSTWGPNPWPLATQLAWFEGFWSKIDSSFVCFEGLDVDWDSLHTAYEAEITAGVSKGRLVAILNHLGLVLHESHTYVSHGPVNLGTPLEPGVPLLVGGGDWGLDDRFGACLTPLPDQSLLVYRAVPSHPLGLVAGDVVLGYDGVPWSQLYPELIDAQLPVRRRVFWGSSEPAYTHGWLTSAGLNWHLFETIDIVEYDTGDTLHLPTSLLVGQSLECDCDEQLDVPGVPKVPGYDAVSWGIVEGTNVGYIYVRRWNGDAESAFYDAVSALMDTGALIIDFRSNFGGNMFLSNPGLSLLFDEIVPTIGFSIRCSPEDHFALCPYPGEDPSVYNIPGDPGSYYGKPIAVLTGPGSVSSGDQVALRMTFHPEARTFGKPTTAAFNSPLPLSIGSPWTARYADADAYLLSDPGNHLTRDVLPVDVDVWLTQNDVALGIDTVVQAALDWIGTVATDAANVAMASKPALRAFPVPFLSHATIRFALPDDAQAEVAVYDVMGRRVRTLLSRLVPGGDHSLVWDGRDSAGKEVSSGVYFVRLATESAAATTKVVRAR